MRRLSLALLLSLLGACTSMPPRPLPADPELAWQERQFRIASIHDWGLSGRLGIQTDHEGWHLSIEWQQEEKAYSILLTAPLGQGSLKLDGSDSGVVLQTDEGESYFASDPAELLNRQFGWRVPVNALSYWVLGVPAPGESREETLDEYGRLASLQQDGWKIRFLDYEVKEGTDLELPGRVFIDNHQGKIRLVISEWQFPGQP